MHYRDRQIIVVARLKAKPLLAGQLIAALAFAALAWGQVWPVRRDGAGEMIRSLLFGDAVATALMIAAAFAFRTCWRLWRQRESYVFHDGVRLYRGSTLSWPLAAIRDVVTDRGALGLPTLRLVVDDDSEVTRALVPLPLLEGSPQAVRGGVLFAATGMRGVPGGVTVN
ncbi:hypothetical protein L7H23_14825 [Sphingopyxis sp. BSN-002]|uniref:hypothetical protein n=1 Tax=Sphingopyxis sp. BSN-002 TaxID=2911495 RepID=UPI001EDBA564|nr:hypothetical protein [Sphingopyxis sp. BSN-002]UKK83829.1 hypothetical protein L7H23_14825 [Sphingopyxis sp. BSN-002]